MKRLVIAASAMAALLLTSVAADARGFRGGGYRGGGFHGGRVAGVRGGYGYRGAYRGGYGYRRYGYGLAAAGVGAAAGYYGSTHGRCGPYRYWDSYSGTCAPH